MDQYDIAKEMYKKGYSLRHIENELGINRKRLSNLLKKEGLFKERGMSKEKIEEAKKLLSQGMKIIYIANKIGVDKNTLSKFFKQSGIREPQKYKRDRSYDNQILELYSNKYSIVSISNLLNISTNKVWNCLTDHGYKVNNYCKHNYNRNIFKIIDTEHKAYWLGFLYADGYVNINKGIELTLSAKDKEHLVQFKNFMETTTDLEFRENTNAYRLCIYSVELAKDLEKLGCFQNKSLVLKFPTESQVPKHLVHHFMRGYFDGDGSIGRYKVGSYPTLQSRFSVLGTDSFLDTYEMFLLKAINRKHGNKRKLNGKAKSINFSGNIQVKKISNFLYKNATIYLKRKQQKMPS